MAAGPADHGGLAGVLGGTIELVSAAEAAELAERFGLRGSTVTPLTGERDSNFRLCAPDGGEWVLKVVHPGEDPAVTDLQNQAMLHVARRDPALPTPRPRLPLTVWWEPSGRTRRQVRVYSWLPGVPPQVTPLPAPQLRQMASLLARLGVALADLRHPAEHHALLWNMQLAAQVRPLLTHLDDPGRRSIPERLLDVFLGETLPAMRGLRWQLIHNDLNPHNMVVDPASGAVSGIIDFGDMVRAPLVQDLATACAYHIPAHGHPLAAALEMVRAYHAVCPLLPAEIDVLFDAMAARGAVSVAISGWRARMQPENAPYINRNARRAWAAMERLVVVPRAEARAMLHAACTGDASR